MNLTPESKNIEKLQKIYDFLKANRVYNDIVHFHEYRKALLPFSSPKEKIISLMHYVVNTQSQPNIDKLAYFFQQLEKYGNFESITGFIQSLLDIPDKEGVPSKEKYAIGYWGLFNRLKDKPGWGDKTAALLVKALFKIHNQYSEELTIWEKTKKGLPYPEDTLLLPLDAVIMRIFEELGYFKSTFATINQLLKNNDWDIEIWDDLWFWGFITQKTLGDKREIEFNLPKLLTLPPFTMNQSQIPEIEKKAFDFIKLLKS